jgi:hypothetical protein
MKNSHSAGADKPANGTIETRDDTNLQFGWFEWLLALGMALTWGSSFLLIDIIIRDDRFLAWSLYFSCLAHGRKLIVAINLDS